LTQELESRTMKDIPYNLNNRNFM